MRRRKLLTATAIGIAGIAGCSSDSGGDGTATGNGTEAASATPAETATGSMGDSGAMDLSTPEATVRTFYDTLYGNDDIEGANELYHPESEAPAIKEEDFSDFNGVSAITADVQSTEVVSESETETEVHATVDYNSPAGPATLTDWFTLAPSDGEWLILTWFPETVRNQGTPTPTPSN
ncbi:hypothetical protein [Haloarcula salinisoli]|uniref:Uncharacterized protein n=1 Tax=Haloarcula salinisoli TaxID=2487746 RepID=A0A8J7YB76_9EURY|nr:hypothetical protein [Halomicroarcula salinisoli]MBX0286255.1 hypothetical protein [Halomicroarcula salinisoli]MBX0302257.1 hypothetical protein [Halomicroarcula salinisoli]